MIHFKLELIGLLNESGCTEHEVEQGTRLFDWLPQYLKTQSNRIQKLFLENDQIAPSIMVVLNNEQVLPTSHPVLKDKDEVLLLPAISGG
ncbi:MAG: MoaD/ThiS family protein [Gemmataceae bacterium]|jgi:molybdopterin converting factor small subunit|nr:MoaD/ThiS family protein [Gemmataceae bacterium]